GGAARVGLRVPPDPLGQGLDGAADARLARPAGLARGTVVIGGIRLGRRHRPPPGPGPPPWRSCLRCRPRRPAPAPRTPGRLTPVPQPSLPPLAPAALPAPPAGCPRSPINRTEMRN